MQSLFITYCLGDTSGAFLFGCNSIRIIWYCRVKTHLFLGGLVVWGVWRLPSGGFVAAWASFCGLLNMVICAVEIHFHLLGWWVVCVVFWGSLTARDMGHFRFSRI